MKKILFITVAGYLLLWQQPGFAADKFQEVYQSLSGTHKIVLLVNSSIYAPIESSLNQYIADLEAEDYHVIVTKYISGTAHELKDVINKIMGVKS